MLMGFGRLSSGAAITLRYDKRISNLRKRPRHCSYIQGNQLGLERTPKWLLEHDVDILKKEKKKRRCYLRKVKIYSLYGIFPHYPDVTRYVNSFDENLVKNT